MNYPTNASWPWFIASHIIYIKLETKTDVVSPIPRNYIISYSPVKLLQLNLRIPSHMINPKVWTPAVRNPTANHELILGLKLGQGSGRVGF